MLETLDLSDFIAKLLCCFYEGAKSFLYSAILFHVFIPYVWRKKFEEFIFQEKKENTKWNERKNEISCISSHIINDGRIVSFVSYIFNVFLCPGDVRKRKIVRQSCTRKQMEYNSQKKVELTLFFFAFFPFSSLKIKL